MKKQRTLKSNPAFRKNVLTRLKNSSNGIIEICADDFDLDCETFASLLDDVRHDGFVSPVRHGLGIESVSFQYAVSNNDTVVKISITDIGSDYFKRLSDCQP